MPPKSRAWALAIIVLVATSSSADDPVTLTIEDVIREMVKLPNGSVVAASWWALYELDAAGIDGSP